ncbi:MAG TPA: hypothetical protein VGS58_02905 [Candidatus Sulfopaludibacter sp.]|nr:hypothetical protein [Candidatus Sulfopaludibacter sp.]
MNSSLEWKVAGAALVAALALAPLGCKRSEKVQVQETVEEGPRLVSSIAMGDPKLETQLVSGFYGIEGNAWRWTAKSFTAVLKTPFGGSQRGGTLELALTVPGVVIEKEKNVSLAASVDGKPLPPESYTQAGAFSFKRDIPAEWLKGESVKVEFQLDKAMPPSGADQRELGIIANALSLGTK